MILNKILDFFKPRPLSKPGTSDNTDPHAPIARTGIELKESLTADILNALMPLRYELRNVQSLTLKIVDYPNPMVIESMLLSAGFEAHLRLALINASINLGSNWLWQYQLNVSPKQTATKINEGLWLEMEQFAGGIGKVKARITAIKGLLKQDQFIIDSTQKINNIGRGSGSRLSTGVYHINHIIIADIDEPSIEAETESGLNRYVSRAHAAIVFKQVEGYVLKVYPGGCFLQENRTRIFRPDEPPIEVMNTLLDYPLKSGDQIELGKSVVLHFEII